MERIISCDWGTSVLRLRLVDVAAMTVCAETICDNGVVSTFASWQAAGKPGAERILFYQSVLQEQIRTIQHQLDISPDDVPIVISGMASSNIGMAELPYKEIPFSADEADLYAETIEATDEFKHKALLVSGAKTNDDVMRGEETQLIGCINKNNHREQFFIFPGTHSKHINVSEGMVTGIKTFMTGEFFELLSKKSILANDIKEGELSGDSKMDGFKKGVADGMASNLLHSSFLVRTNSLLGKLTKEENYHYLSGLVIGTELKDLNAVKIPLTIVGNNQQRELYKIALEHAGMNEAKYFDAGEAMLRGHCKLSVRLEKK